MENLDLGERRQHPGQHRAGANAMPQPAELKKACRVRHNALAKTMRLNL